MKKTLNAALGLLLLFSSCDRVIIGEGPVVKQSRLPGAFSKLELDIPATLTYIVADSVSLTIAAQENIIGLITTETDGALLEIKSTEDYKSDIPVEIIMTVRPLDAIFLNGSGEIRGINTMSGDELKLEINGAGDIKGNFDYQQLRSEIKGSGDLHLSGKVQEHKAQINGSGDINAVDLLADICRVTINGSGDAEVQVASKLQVKVTGSGTVKYSGTPAIASEITGSGEVKKLD